MNLQFQQGDPTWLQLRERCKNDLWFLAGTVLGYGDKVKMNLRVHGLFCKFLERKLGIPAIDQCPHRKVLMPREAGKSTLGTQAYTIQRILQNPNIAILIANEKLENAAAFLSAIKQEFSTNEFLRELFPDIIPDPKSTVWATDKIVVTRTQTRREPTIFCIGEGGTVTGMHPDLIIADDLFSREAMENARSGNSDMTGKINRWISQLRNLVNAWAEPFPELLFIGTHWFAGDPYHYVEEAYGYGEVPRIWHVTQKLPPGDPFGISQTIPIKRIGDLAVFKRSAIEDGRTIWPENPKFTMEALAKARTDDPVLFAANMLNDPSDPLITTFKEHWLRFFDWTEDAVRIHDPASGIRELELRNLDRCILVDPGGFKKMGTKDKARGAVIVTGTDLKSHSHLLLETWSEQATFETVAKKVLEFASRYEPRTIAIEDAGQQAAFIALLKLKAQEVRPGHEWRFQDVSPASTDKFVRIGRLESYFERGQLFLGKGGGTNEFREQYRQFPRGRRVDLLDALAYGPQIWRKPGLTTVSTGMRHQQERTQYWARRTGAAYRPLS